MRFCSGIAPGFRLLRSRLWRGGISPGHPIDRRLACRVWIRARGAMARSTDGTSRETLKPGKDLSQPGSIESIDVTVPATGRSASDDCDEPVGQMA